MGSSRSRYNQYSKDSPCYSNGGCSSSAYAPSSWNSPCQISSFANSYPPFGPFNSFSGYGYYTGTLVGYGYGF